MNRWERWRAAVRMAVGLGGVEAALPGTVGDGLVAARAGTELDRPWSDQLDGLTTAANLWRVNPLARRLVNLVTSFVVGDGITVTSDEPELARFLDAFWHHPQNQMSLRQYQWCDELSRSGELFVTLHFNEVDGMSYARALPASRIDRVVCAGGDYEAELAFHEMASPWDADFPAGRWWQSAIEDGRLKIEDGESSILNLQSSIVAPVALHFAVNRPVGCVRGESDLAPVRLWLERYSRWLEDRVQLNAAMRAFLWIVKVPGRAIKQKAAEHSRPPEPGSVLFVDKDSEEWEAVAPALHAADAAADGRALRWMVVAGGPGVGLVDLGEGEEANLATAKAMAEQRSRFMRARQTYFGWALATVALTAYNRAVRLGYIRGEERTLSAVRLVLPDISPADNRELGASAAQAAEALMRIGEAGLSGERWKRLALRTVMKFAGEPVSEGEVSEILRESGELR
jgi:hypothetical protein